MTTKWHNFSEQSHALSFFPPCGPLSFSFFSEFIIRPFFFFLFFCMFLSQKAINFWNTFSIISFCHYFPLKIPPTEKNEILYILMQKEMGLSQKKVINCFHINWNNLINFVRPKPSVYSYTNVKNHSSAEMRKNRQLWS